MDFFAGFEHDSKKLYIKKGEMIYRTGDQIDVIYFLDQGMVKLAEDAPDGHPVTVFLLERGEYFGFLDYLNNRSEQTYYAVAMTDATLFALPLELALKQLDRLNEFEKTLFITLAKQLSDAKKLIYVHSKMTVAERLGWFLKKLAEKSEGEGSIHIPLTHEEIAYMVGCSRQKVTAYLNQWKKEGIIEYDRGFIKLVKMEKLGQDW